MRKFKLFLTLLMLAIFGCGQMWGAEMKVDFESATSAYSDWTFTTLVTKATNSGVTPHGGSYFGGTNGQTAGSVVTKNKIASPSSITFYVSKESNNTTSSSWLIKVSTDGSTWTQVGDAQSASSMTKGTWVDVNRDLSSYSDVYVGVFYEGTTAKRCIDDLVLTTSDGAGDTETCETPTFDQEDGATFTEDIDVEIACTTTGATIYYTTDGTNPTTSSNVYSSALNFTETTTLKAIAVKAGLENSEVASATYTKVVPITSNDIDFETNDLSLYVNWDFLNVGIKSTTITAHGGTYYGANINSGGNGVSTCSITSKNKIASPGTLKFYVSKESTNTTSSSWKVEVSSDKSTWTKVGNDQSATSMTKGNWTEVSRDLSSYSNVYVRISYGSSGAIRTIDDITLTTITKYAVNITAPTGGTLVVKDGDNAITSGDSFVAGKTLTVVATPDGSHTGGTVYVNDEELSGTTITVPANEITVSATFIEKSCDKLNAPALDTITKTYNSATIAWKEVTDAVSYLLNVTEHEGDAVLTSDSINGLSKALTDLKAETRYDYTVMAIGDGTEKCDAGNYLLEGNFTTDEAPVFTVNFVTGTSATQNPIAETKRGLGISIPAGPALSQTCQENGWSFAGWAAAAVASETTTAPAKLYQKDEIYTPNVDNDTLYAVYRRSEGGSAGAAVNTILWSEDWTGASNKSTPESPTASGSTVYGSATVTYAWTDGGTTTQVMDDNQGPHTDATNPNVLVSKSNGDLTISGIPTGAASSITLSYAMSGGGTLEISTTTNNVSIDGNTITISSTEVSAFNLVFKNSHASKNLRLDDIVVTVATAGTSSTTYYLSAPNCCEKHAITIASGLENGTVSANLAEACEDSIVTLTFTPAGSYHLDSWSIDGTAQDVNATTFTMPDSAVIVSATFAHDACQNLVAPALESIDSTYNSATITWGAVENASSYLVSVIDTLAKDTIIFNESVNALSKALSGLKANTKYNYSIMAVGDTINYCAEGNPTLDSVFTTDALPEVKLTLMVGGAEDERSANHAIQTPFNLPDSAAVEGCPKVFVGWSKDAARATEPEYAPGAEYTIADENPDTLYAVFAIAGAGATVTYPIDFEGDASTYANWMFTNMVSNYSNSGVPAHGGSKIGSTDGKATASVVTLSKVAAPTALTAYVSKQTTNTTSSTWYVQVSSDGSTWTDVESASATSMDKGKWNAINADLSTYSNVYVRVYYSGSTAVRCIDDLVLSAVGPATYSDYSTECEACKTVTLAKAGEAGNNNFALKIGNDTVESVQTCAAVKVAIVPTVTTGYEVSFAIDTLEGVSIVEDTIYLAKDAEGALIVSATFSQINYSVIMAQEGDADAELSADQSDKHYGDTITISTKVPDGYVFTGWTTDTAVTFIENYDASMDTTKFIMPNSAVTATAHFGRVYTVSFNAGSEPLTEDSIGAGVTLPAGPALSQACQDDGWSFAGWAGAEVVSETTTVPELNIVGATFKPTNDTTLYAVYKRTEVSAVTDKEITETFESQTKEAEYNTTKTYEASASNANIAWTMYYGCVSENVKLTGNQSAQMRWYKSATTTYGYIQNTTPISGLQSVSFNAKTDNGNSSTVKISVWYSTDGEEWTKVKDNEAAPTTTGSISATISGTVGTDYYVRIGVGDAGTAPSSSSAKLTIDDIQFSYKAAPTTDYYLSAPNCCTKHAITIASGIEHGTVTVNLAEACKDSIVTLTFTPAENYHLKSWSVDGAEKDSTVNTFVMPDSAVIISAIFAQDACTPLDKPVVAVSDTVYPYDAVKLTWSAISYADAYKVYIYDENNAELEHNDAFAGVAYTIGQTLSGGTTYKYFVQAISNSPAVYCPSDSVKGSYKTAALPAATLTLSENGADYKLAGEHSLTEVVTLPDTLHFSGCNGKVLKGWSSVKIDEAVNDEPTENYWAAGATNYAISAVNDTLYAVFATESAGQVSNVFAENFSTISTGNSTATSGSGTAWTPNDNFNETKNAVYQAGGAIRLGKSGSIMTKALDLSGGTVTVSFKLKGWSASENTVTVQVDEQATQSATCTGYMSTGDFESKSLTFAAGKTTSVVKFTTSSSVRIFLDDIEIKVTGVACSEYTTACAAALDAPVFSPAAQTAAFTTAQTVTLSAEEGTIYYTLDGSDPTNESTEYTAPIILDKCGSYTIKAIAISATNQSPIASATYVIAIEQPTSSADAPFTPAMAIGVFDSGCYGNDSVYVKGVVKTSSGWNSSYGNYDNIVVVAEGTDTPEFTFYHMYKAAGKVQFEATDSAIVAGDTIVAYGALTKYNAIYEFKDGCYLIDRKVYTAPKQSIANDLDGAYTLAEAINFLDNPTTYDLSDTVYVKGVANDAPNNQSTFTAHDPEVENSFQFYNTNLNNLTIGAKDTVIVKGIIKHVNSTYRMDAGEVQQVKAYVAHTIAANPDSVAFGSVEQEADVDAIEVNVYLTNVANATVTLADENNVFSIDKNALTETGVVTVSASAATIGEYAATITIHDEAEVAEDVVVNVTMNVTAKDTRKKAQDLDGFEALSGNLNADIAFASAQGDGTATPTLNDGTILYYQPASGKAAGGYMTLTAVKGCTIDQVKVVTANHDTKIKYSKNGGALSEATDVTAGGEYQTPASLGAQTVNIYCAGADKNHRLYVAQIVVYYTGEAKAVDHYTVDTTAVVTKEFKKNAPFSSAGLKVYACYETDESDNVDITADCHVMADLTSIGQKMAEVYLGEQKLGEYHINVIAGQDDPKLAYTPASQILEAAEVGTWSAPIFKNDSNVSPIIYSSDNEAVATVDENGVIALAGDYGTVVITAIFAETEDYIADTATYSLTIKEPINKIEGKWLMATAADIKPGIKVIVVGEKNNIKYAMGAQNTNNRAAVARESIVADTLYAAEGTKTFTLVDAGNGLYAFKANNGKYLFAASGSNNYLREQATIDGNASWKISIAGNGEATIKAQGSNSRNWMSMVLNGQNPPLFSSYKEKQSAIALYVNRTVITGNDDPTAEPDSVVISGNVTEEEIVASGNVVVEVTQNFEEPKSYIAQNGATIIINNEKPAKSVIADSTSTIKVTKPTKVNKVFSVAATMGGGKSGQVYGSNMVEIAESTEAFFDIKLGDNANPEHWHAIAVPFPVDAINGIYDAETGAKLENEVNYAIMDYHGDIRATGGYGWKKYRQILQPGVFYLMTVDGNTKTFRFKMSGTTLPTATSLALQLFAQTSGNNMDGGWNGVANPTLQHGTVNQTVTVLNPSTYTYEDKDAGEMNFVVGTPFFIQANAYIVEEGMEMTDTVAGKPYYAPRRTSEKSIENIKVFFGNEVYKDKLTISANEEALNEYQIGKDLVKMTMTNTPKVAQIFGNAYNAKMSRIYAPMSNDKAEYSLTLYAPKAGEYTISAPQMDNADLYLTYNGSIIWNLSMSEYTTDFAKGNNEGYGLLLVKKVVGVATGVENGEVLNGANGVQKIIVDDKVFILRGGQMYDVTGKAVK